MASRVNDQLYRTIRMQFAARRYILGLDELGHLPNVGLPALPKFQGH